LLKIAGGPILTNTLSSALHSSTAHVLGHGKGKSPEVLDTGCMLW